MAHVGRLGMRRPQGYGVTSEPGKRDVEEDSFTCVHCNGIVFVSDAQGNPVPVDEVGGFCLRCMRNTCPACTADGRCVPFELKLEAMERRDRLMRAL